MKKYTFELVITEGNDEFWESIKDKSGCDEVNKLISDILIDNGFFEHEANLKLKKYENV